MQNEVERIERPDRRERAKQAGAGFSFIEVLVTLLLLGIGFTNLIGLQAAAKKANYDSLQRTTAVVLARDIIEKMRANPGSLDSYLTTGTGIGGNTLSEPDANCSAQARCNTGQLAGYDMWQWEQALDGANEVREIAGEVVATGGLVNPAACIQTTPGSASAAGKGTQAFQITVAWRGLHPLDNVSDTTCGIGSGNFGAQEQYRRSVTLTAHITSSS